MNGGRSLAALLAAVVLASASACSALTPALGPAAAVDCATLTPAAVMRALREADSYAFHARGTIARYAATVGDTDEVEHLDVRGAYTGPDRLNLEFDGHEDALDELRLIGTNQWVRDHGSLRWRPVEDTERPSHNQLLAEIERITGWSAPDETASPGLCTLSGSDSFATDDQAVTASVTVITPLAGAMPSEIAIDYRYDPPTPRAGALASRQLAYEVDADGDAAIEEPAVNTTAATDEDLRYALRHLACAEPPCSIENLRVVYAHHQPGLDMVGFEAGGRAGEAWFDSGRIRHVVQRGCVAPAFAWHEHDADDGSTYLGGPLTLADSATLRVSYSDGSAEELAITAPVYVVPNRQHTDDGASIVSVELLGPDGTYLLDEARSGHEGHAAAC